MVSLIVVKDPTKFDYTDFIEKIIVDKCPNGVDILIDTPIKDFNSLNQVLSTLYGTTRRIATQNSHDYRFEINVLFNKSSVPHSMLFKVDSETVSTSHSATAVEIEARLTQTSVTEGSSKQYAVTAVGGTFDHLHDGHKILLSMCVFLTQHKLIVGITGPELLKNKKYADVMQPFIVRQSSVIDFITLVAPKTLTYSIYMINDVCGPTGYIPEINALVLSEESAKGGEFVNKTRASLGFNELEVACIKVIGGDDSNEGNQWEGKLSSTDIRGMIKKNQSEAK